MSQRTFPERPSWLLPALLLSAWACQPAPAQHPLPAPCPPAADTAALSVTTAEEALGFAPADLAALQARLTAHFGAAHGPRLQRGLQQVSERWRSSDGDLAALEAFVSTHFITDPERLAQTLARFDANLEALSGHHTALRRHLRGPIDLDQGAPLPVDSLFFAYDPLAHAQEDAFASGLAFVALLNFPIYSLAELDHLPLSRAEWAAARLAAGYALRVPGEVMRRLGATYAAVREYTSSYNIHMANIRVGEQQPFPEGKGLISHWGLRDELKAHYAFGPAGTEAQRIIYTIMERIIRQEIPAEVIDHPDLLWDPIANALPARPDATPAPEPNTRYRHFLSIFHAEQAVDAYTPSHPTHPARRFDLRREMSVEAVEALLIAVLTDPVALTTAEIIAGRLGRPLEAFDIWYNGFRGGQGVPDAAELSAQTQARYPTAAAFEADLGNIFARLGFSAAQIALLTAHIAVDASRGAGHAMRAGMRSDKARLRTRVGAEGMDYKGYNIAMHELGHNVEQVFSLNLVDHFVLSGVPNTAFTEAFAFVFQRRDLEVLGAHASGPVDPEVQQAASDLGLYWSTFEIAGVAMLDIAVWRYLYAHPELDAEGLRQAVIALAIEIWNTYYAPVLGVRDSPILAIYSHMIAYGLYLPDYPLGHLIEVQIEAYLEGRDLATEMERMCRQGRLTPQQWMVGAVGTEVSAEPLLAAARRAVALLRP